jgi:hypothetical protein
MHCIPDLHPHDIRLQQHIHQRQQQLIRITHPIQDQQLCLWVTICLMSKKKLHELLSIFIYLLQQQLQANHKEVSTMTELHFIPGLLPHPRLHTHL